MLNFKNILVPTDFSRNSIQALEFAYYLASNNNISLHLLYVLEPSNYSFNLKDMKNKNEIEKSRLKDAEEKMRCFISNISLKGAKIIESICTGKAHEQILGYANNNKIDLIIISSHGWTGLSHLITGNVTNKVMRYSEVPTICIKSNSLVMQKGMNANKSPFAENWIG